MINSYLFTAQLGDHYAHVYLTRRDSDPNKDHDIGVHLLSEMIEKRPARCAGLVLRLLRPPRTATPSKVTDWLQIILSTTLSTSGKMVEDLILKRSSSGSETIKFRLDEFKAGKTDHFYVGWVAPNDDDNRKLMELH